MFERKISTVFLECVQSFPVTVLTGPRQSGKTTLIKHLLPKFKYYSLEDPETLLRVQTDPRSFIEEHSQGIIFDEAQALPELFSYIQTVVDKINKPGQFILSGSQNFLLSQKVSQTLAGRAAILELLPLSYEEYLTSPQTSEQTIWTQVYNGGYPRPYEQQLNRRIWQNSYIQTYLERDVRSLINVKDIIKFRQFLSLCAGRHGQLVNMNELANDAGVSHTTVKEWLRLLEASYIVYRLTPYHNNFNKRIVKTPKLYFYDSGLICQLLGIESPEHLKQHAARGTIFEGYVITEFMKHFINQAMRAPIYFWRDQTGIEVDLLIDRAGELSAVEIKSGETYIPDMLKGLKRWASVSKSATKNYLVYGGKERFQQQDFQIFPWTFKPEALT